MLYLFANFGITKRECPELGIGPKSSGNGGIIFLRVVKPLYLQAIKFSTFRTPRNILFKL